MYDLECKQTCGNCKNKEQCHHVNGSCLNGCDSGYYGTRCDIGMIKELLLLVCCKYLNMKVKSNKFSRSYVCIYVREMFTHLLHLRQKKSRLNSGYIKTINIHPYVLICVTLVRNCNHCNYSM